MRQITLLLTLLFSFVCGGIHAQKTDKPMRVLVAYYSYSGNTRTVARQIQHAAGSSAKDATSRVEKWLKDIGIVE